MKLRTALELVPGDVVAFAGAGGKTSALVRLARELTAEGARVLVTTTTRVALAELTLFDAAALPDAAASLAYGRSLFVYGGTTGEKALGLTPEALDGLIAELRPDYTLVEADGSRRLPLKMPKAHEPVIPACATVLVQVAGMAALREPLDDAHVYYAERVAQAAGAPPGTRVTAPVIAAALAHALPSHAPPRVYALLNGVSLREANRVTAERIARLALNASGGGLTGVLCGAVQAEEPVLSVQRPVHALVMAAGMSRRMGRSKPLLDWGGRTVIEQVIAALKAGGVTSVTVVTGAQAEAVTAAAQRAGAEALHNPDYAAGDMLSSLQAGLRYLLPTRAHAALVALGDQPMIRPRVVARLLRAYAEGRGGIVAPSHAMRRGHPILLTRPYWQDILALPAGSAPRDAINRHADDTAYVSADESVLSDIDTPEAYAEARRRAGLPAVEL